MKNKNMLFYVQIEKYLQNLFKSSEDVNLKYIIAYFELYYLI